MTQLNLSTTEKTGHSSDVRMWLNINGRTFDVCQSGGTRIMVEDSSQVPLGDAVLTITVDGRPHQHFIRILGPDSRPNWLAVERR